MRTYWIYFIACMITASIFNTSCQKQTDYSPQINSLQASLLSLQKRCDSLAIALNKANLNLQITNTNVGNLTTSIATIQTQVASILSQIATLTSQLSSTNADVVTINIKITDLNSQLNNLLLQMNNLLAQQSIINSLQASLTKLQNRCDSVVNALVITNSNLQTTNNSLTSLQNQVTTISGQIVTLNSQLNSTNVNVSSILNQITDLNNQYTNLTTQINLILIKLGMLPTSLKSGLVAWYPFSGNANDESGNLNNGTVIGAALTSDRFGNSGKAYSFNGMSNYINYLDGSTSGLNVIGNISLSFWFKTTQTTTGVIFSFGDQINSFNGGYEVGFSEGSAPTGNLAYAIRTQGNWHYSSAKLNDNVWHNAIITLNAATLSLYVDGNLDNQYLTALPTLSWNGSRRIGVANYGLVGYYSGLLDDMGIWNRALTQQEVSLLSVTN
jgi:predicted  nucleic acid-binding Zn-ribbon protein